MVSAAVEQDPSHVDKQPIKWMELPIMKFNEVAVPHHVNRLKALKNNIQKCQRGGDWVGAHREQMNANSVIKQLRALVKEMDVLRSRVIDEDIHKFDKMINNSRQLALNMLQEYIDLSHDLPSTLSDYDSNSVSGKTNNKLTYGGFNNYYCNSDDDNCSSYSNVQRSCPSDSNDDDQCQVQRMVEMTALTVECQDQERCAIAWENLQKDIEEVQQLYQELADIVQTQEEAVTNIETNVESAHEHVDEGEKELLKAARLKVASYPFAGALIGSFMGGPVGVIAGFKMGGIVALTCSILGFTGGRFLKRKQHDVVHEHSS